MKHLLLCLKQNASLWRSHYHLLLVTHYIYCLLHVLSWNSCFANISIGCENHFPTWITITLGTRASRTNSYTFIYDVISWVIKINGRFPKIMTICNHFQTISVGRLYRLIFVTDIHPMNTAGLLKWIFCKCTYGTLFPFPYFDYLAST